MVIADQKYYIPDLGYFVFRKCTQDWIMEEQRIHFIDITYITEGHAKYKINGTTYEVKSGDLLCLPFGSVRSAISDPADQMGCYSLNFLLQNLRGEVIQLPLPVCSHIGLRNDIISLLLDLSVVWSHKESGYYMKSQALVILMLHKLFELVVYRNDSKAIDPRIQKTIKYISDHYSENLTVVQLSELVKLKPVYFGALFKKWTGVTVNNYLTQIRVNRAENMLCSREYTIAEIAERCGYNDIRYFRKQFKSVFGYPPSQYLIIKSSWPFEFEASQTAQS